MRGWLALALLPGLACAETVTVTTTYMTRDTDSKGMAHNACVLLAERLAVSKTGTFLEAETTVIAKDDGGKVFSVATERTRGSVASVVRSDVTNEAYTPEGNLTCTVAVSYDPNKLVPVAQPMRPAVADEIERLEEKAKTIVPGMTLQQVVDYMGPGGTGWHPGSQLAGIRYGRALVYANNGINVSYVSIDGKMVVK